MPKEKTDLLQGTLDLLILKALQLGPMHGFGVSVLIRQMSKEVLRVEQGSLYPALYRLEQQGWITSEWGVSGNNRKAKFLPCDSDRPKAARGGASDLGAAFGGDQPGAQDDLTLPVMDVARKIRGWIRVLFCRQELDSQMDDEMRSHIELQTQENIESGLRSRLVRRD